MKQYDKTLVNEFIMNEVVKILGVTREDISEDDNLINSGISSMEIVGLFVSIQENFEVDISSNLDLHASFISVNTMSQLVLDKIRRSNSND